jgi:hypothetical protein
VARLIALEVGDLLLRGKPSLFLFLVLVVLLAVV